MLLPVAVRRILFKVYTTQDLSVCQAAVELVHAARHCNDASLGVR